MYLLRWTVEKIGRPTWKTDIRHLCQEDLKWWRQQVHNGDRWDCGRSRFTWWRRQTRPEHVEIISGGSVDRVERRLDGAPVGFDSRPAGDETTKRRSAASADGGEWTAGERMDDGSQGRRPDLLHRSRSRFHCRICRIRGPCRICSSSTFLINYIRGPLSCHHLTD